MPIRIDEKRTDRYIGTFHYDSAEDMLELDEIKKMVKNLNKMLRESGYKYRFRVALRGRLGKNNPKAEKYREKGHIFYRSNRYQMIRLEDAQRVDAYIYQE